MFLRLLAFAVVAVVAFLFVLAPAWIGDWQANAAGPLYAMTLEEARVRLNGAGPPVVRESQSPLRPFAETAPDRYEALFYGERGGLVGRYVAELAPERDGVRARLSFVPADPAMGRLYGSDPSYANLILVLMREAIDAAMQSRDYSDLKIFVAGLESHIPCRAP